MTRVWKPVCLMVVLALVLSLAAVVLPASEARAANLFEHYNTGDDNVWGFYSQYWKAQTFTAESNHSVTSVKLKLWRSGSPGTVTVSIRATDGSGHPTGTDLTSGTTDGNTLTTDSAGEWREIALTSYPLISGTKYAIVVKALGGDASNRVWWRLDESSPTYDGGNLEHSESSGASWTSYADMDFMFEVWEELPPVASFSAQPPMGDAPHTVRFHSTSTGDIDEWSWSFGDGETSKSRNPTHTYQNEGTYTVSLTVDGPGGDDRKVKRDLIIVESPAVAPKLVVRNLQISAVHAQPRQAIGISASVVNEGGAWGSDTVQLLINGYLEQSVGVGVAPGTSQPISFTVYKVEPREYQVTIGDATGTFYVMGEVAPLPAPKAGLLVGGELDTTGIIFIIVIGVILVGGIVVMVLLSRRA